MSPELEAALPKLLIPLAAAVAAFAIARARGLPLREAFGLDRPGARSAMLWLAFWAVWVIASELVARAVGVGAPDAWTQRDPLAIGVRVLAIGILGPALEELVFRGMLFYRLKATRLGPAGAAVVLGVVFGAIHIQAGLGSVVQASVDGVVFGVARWKTGSIWVPIAMHASGNLVSISQSLGLL